MSETLDDQQDCSSERLGWIGAICIGLVFGWLLALPICFLSLQRGIAVGLIFTPVFTLLAYCLGGFIPFVQYMGLMLATFVLVTINNAFHGLIPVERLIPSDTDSEAVDSATQAELETKAKILETDLETEFDRLANILRATDLFGTAGRY